METKNNVNDDKFREELRKAITKAFNVHGEKLEKILRIFMEKHKFDQLDLKIDISGWG